MSWHVLVYNNGEGLCLKISIKEMRWEKNLLFLKRLWNICIEVLSLNQKTTRETFRKISLSMFFFLFMFFFFLFLFLTHTFPFTSGLQLPQSPLNSFSPPALPLILFYILLFYYSFLIYTFIFLLLAE